MPKGERLLTSLEMRSLILEALSLENVDETPRGATFKMHEYKGTLDDLRAIVEFLAIRRNLLDEVAPIQNQAWGAFGYTLIYERNTNFNEDEINLFFEEVHYLIAQNVVSPGAYRNYGQELPNFHVTKYGMSCLAVRDILPYDPEGYIAKLKSLATIDPWEEFYISQSLRCFNAGAYEASLILIGIEAEYIAEMLLDKMKGFLQTNEIAMKATFETALANKKVISKKYQEYETIINSLRNLPPTGARKYPDLEVLCSHLDNTVRPLFAAYLRLSRNELAHPSAMRIDRIECLMFFVTFMKYCDYQHKFLDYYSSHS